MTEIKYANLVAPRPGDRKKSVTGLYLYYCSKTFPYPNGEVTHQKEISSMVALCEVGIFTLLFIAFLVLYTISCQHSEDRKSAKKQQDLQCKNNTCNAVASIGMNGRMTEKEETDEEDAQVDKGRKDALKRAEAEGKRRSFKGRGRSYCR